jgi:2-polyprenyl-3-methyl-5-hydroxy-6-metoxy-1,4-benzoquinol methylase
MDFEMSDIEVLREELFCTQYELSAFSEIMLNGKAERWVPSFTGSLKDDDHMARYELACRYVKDLRVLDIACGAGKGTKLLATKGMAKHATGGDINADAIRYARHRNAASNVSFEEANGLQLPFQREFDLVISYETIEHISDYNRFLSNISGSLQDGGLFIVSTPVSKLSFDEKPENPYHTQEWGFESFQQILTSAGFAIEKIFLQMDLRLGSPGLLRRIAKRLTQQKKNIRHYTGYEEKKLEEFTGQYNVSDFGAIRNGFQIVVCKKMPGR